MKHTEYEIILTNGIVKYTYKKWAFNKTEAIILAQSDAIHEARGYELISCRELNK